MRIAILGGTGKLGLGFASRLHETGHEVMIGSRDAAKAAEAAKSLSGRIRSGSNAESAAWAEAALVAVPYSGHRTLLEPLREQLSGKIVIDATVPIDPADLFQIKTESGKSAAEETAEIASGADVFAAFQTVSHRVLRQRGISHDVLIAGDSPKKPEVMELVRSMELRPVNAGPLRIAGHLERMTVLLLSINKANKVKESGIEITGL